VDLALGPVAMPTIKPRFLGSPSHRKLLYRLSYPGPHSAAHNSARSDSFHFIYDRPLDPLGTNYAGTQYGNYIASGALNFDMDTAGRVAAHLCLRDIQRNFQGHSWDQNGPAVIKRVLENLCGTKHVSVGSPWRYI
jgi:hypothetical protein